MIPCYDSSEPNDCLRGHSALTKTIQVGGLNSMAEGHRSTGLVPQQQECKQCHRSLPATLEHFWTVSYSRSGLSGKCYECRRRDERERYARLRGTPMARRKMVVAIRNKKRRIARLRSEVVQGYGQLCQCCGETRIEFLNVDHVQNNGAYERRVLKRQQDSLYYFIIRNNFPPEYRLLCWNCNCARGILGYCPHEVERSLEVSL